MRDLGRAAGRIKIGSRSLEFDVNRRDVRERQNRALSGPIELNSVQMHKCANLTFKQKRKFCRSFPVLQLAANTAILNNFDNFEVTKYNYKDCNHGFPKISSPKFALNVNSLLCEAPALESSHADDYEEILSCNAQLRKL